MTMSESLPYEPPGLRDLIDTLTYKPGWQMNLGLFREDGEPRGWAFYVISDTEDSLNPYRTWHVSDYATAAKRSGDA